MRVALDTNGLFTTRAGVARYIRGLVNGLRQVAPADLEPLELAWEVENFEYRQPQRTLKTAYRELLWAKWIAPRLLSDRKVDLLHSTAGVLITPPSPMKHVATLNDLAVLRFPERFRRWQRWSTKHRLVELKKVDRIICISQFTADEATQLLELPSSRLEVIYPGCDFHPQELPPVEQKPDFEIPSEFFLFVGSLEPGKNLALLKESYRLAADKRESLPPLLIVGARWAGVASEGPPAQGWHYLGLQPDSVLIYLYRRALGLVFPSKYEGFGFPVAEAMALGCAVICSPVASVREVAGDAAYLAPLDPGAYYAAMKLVAADDHLRLELVQKGKQQASQFSWRRCAEQVVQVYRSVCNG